MLTPFEEELEVGSRFAGRFQILGVVGRGSMGIVYQARHELMGRTVAIKMLRGQLAGDERSMRRFEREARAASRMDHPNLISVHDFGLTDNRQPYLVMDFCQGSTLYEIQRRENHLTPVRAVRIFTQVCDALQHAHLQGVIHRDLKPSNIMILEKDGEPDFVKVFDLGIAKIAWGEEEDKEPLTRTNEVCGSPIYLSPEQCKHETLDPRSDIYSLGVVMYELLTGLPPLMGETVYDTIYMHVHEEPRPFAEVRPDLHIPSRMERIVFKALQKDPDNRYQSMQELKWELQASLQASDPHLQVLPPEALPYKRKRPSIGSETPAMTHTALHAEPPGRLGQTPSSSMTPVGSSSGAGMRPVGSTSGAGMRPVASNSGASMRSPASMPPAEPVAAAPPESSKGISATQAAIISSAVSVAVTLGVVAFFVLGHHGGDQDSKSVQPPVQQQLPAATPTVATPPSSPLVSARPTSAHRPIVAPPVKHAPPAVKASKPKPVEPQVVAEKPPARPAQTQAAAAPDNQPNSFFSIFKRLGGGQPAPSPAPASVRQSQRAQQAQQAQQVQQPRMAPLPDGRMSQQAQSYQQQSANPTATAYAPAQTVGQYQQQHQAQEPAAPVDNTPSAEAMNYNNEGAGLLKEDPEQAIGKLQRALELCPTYAKARSNLARAQVNLGNRLLQRDERDAAMTHYREAMRLFKEAGDTKGLQAASDLYKQVTQMPR